MRRMRRAQMEKLARQIAVHDRARRERQSSVDELALTEAERSFCVLADSRGKRVFRHGWPDFLVIDDDTGGVVLVEVKTGGDLVHESQVKMFTALESVGFRVCVWRPEEPLVLAPWRRFVEYERKGRREIAPRTPVHGRETRAQRNSNSCTESVTHSTDTKHDHVAATVIDLPASGDMGVERERA